MKIFRQTAGHNAKLSPNEISWTTAELAAMYKIKKKRGKIQKIRGLSK
jgi:hypothetical protein